MNAVKYQALPIMKPLESQRQRFVIANHRKENVDTVWCVTQIFFIVAV